MRIACTSGILALLFSLSLAAQPSGLLTPFEADSLYSASFEETHAWYQRLAGEYEEVVAGPAGWSDGMWPIYEVILAAPGGHDPVRARQEGRTVVLINNAIHPGEPCGVDASMLLARWLVASPEGRALLDRVVVVIIPYYNVDGGWNRSAYYRANQQGPAAQGFRGNARNLDLNRDFIKTDTRNTMTFARVFHRWDPDLFVDTHTSNGADYPYTMTLIPTQPDKLPTSLAALQQRLVLPRLYAAMADAGWPMCPYVHGDQPPQEGLRGFLDLPRYSTGYAALFHSLGFMTEAHMLKPFADRVWATRQFLEEIVRLAASDGAALQAARAQSRQEARRQDQWPLRWVTDSLRVDSFLFRGYTPEYQPSAITGLPRLTYNHNASREELVPFYARYRPVKAVSRPKAYVVPQAWTEVLTRMALQPLVFERIATDRELEATVYYIQREQTVSRPYEGHFLHQEVVVEARREKVQLRAGDVLLPTDQDAVAYLMHTLEPEAPDSWMAWNFFDAILQQKEYFSPYVFEDLAREWLETRPDVRAELEAWRAEDPARAADGYAQLMWVYRRSPWYEPTHRRYPVLRLEQED